MIYRPAITFILLISFNLTSFAKPWRGIVPLRTTRSEVESKLGKPNEDGVYLVAEGKARIFYGAGEPTATTCWARVSRDVVARVSVTLDFPQKLRDRKGLKLTKNTHHAEMGTYSDWSSGIQYHVSLADFEIASITYEASKKDCDAVLQGGVGFDVLKANSVS